MTSVYKQIGKQIKIARVKKDHTQVTLSQESGVTQPTISRIENGSLNITVSTLTTLCETLGLKIILIES